MVKLVNTADFCEASDDIFYLWVLRKIRRRNGLRVRVPPRLPIGYDYMKLNRDNSCPPVRMQLWMFRRFKFFKSLQHQIRKCKHPNQLILVLGIANRTLLKGSGSWFDEDQHYWHSYPTTKLLSGHKKRAENILKTTKGFDNIIRSLMYYHIVDITSHGDPIRIDDILSLLQEYTGCDESVIRTAVMPIIQPTTTTLDGETVFYLNEHHRSNYQQHFETTKHQIIRALDTARKEVDGHNLSEGILYLKDKAKQEPWSAGSFAIGLAILVLTLL